MCFISETGFSYTDFLSTIFHFWVDVRWFTMELLQLFISFFTLMTMSYNIAGLVCHSCFHLQLDSTFPSIVNNIVNQFLDQYQHPACADDTAITSIQTRTCAKWTGYVSRCTTHKVTVSFEFPLDEPGETFMQSALIQMYSRGCSYYKRKAVPADGCRNQSVPYEDNEIIKAAIQNKPFLNPKEVYPRAEVCVFTANQTAAAQTGISWARVARADVVCWRYTWLKVITEPQRNIFLYKAHQSIVVGLWPKQNPSVKIFQVEKNSENF